MQFKIDENLPDALVTLLVGKGHDVATVRQEALNGRPDADVAAARD
jgi:predicted nuclease of predicted toxin-antitoxin system